MVGAGVIARPRPTSGSSSWRGSELGCDRRFSDRVLVRTVLARDSATKRRIGQTLAPGTDEYTMGGFQIAPSSARCM
jgi:hypothetical protein